MLQGLTRGWALWLGVLLALSSPDLRADDAPVQAAPSPADLTKAKVHYQSGAALYESGKYDAARDAFEESYRLSRLPDLLFNLSAVTRKLGRPGDAIHYLERYLEARPTAADRPKVEADIASLKVEVVALEEAAVDKAAADKAAADKVAADKIAAQREAVESATAALKLAAPRPSRLPPWPALGLAGGGVVFLVVGIGLGGGAIAAANQVDGGAMFDKGLHERGQAMDRGAIAFDVLGALALAGGAAWTAVWWWKGRRSPESNRSRETLRLVPQGAGLGLQATR